MGYDASYTSVKYVDSGLCWRCCYGFHGGFKAFFCKTLQPSRVNAIFMLAGYDYFAVLKHVINCTLINVDLGQILRENLIFLKYIFFHSLKFSVEI